MAGLKGNILYRFFLCFIFKKHNPSKRKRNFCMRCLNPLDSNNKRLSKKKRKQLKFETINNES